MAAGAAGHGVANREDVMEVHQLRYFCAIAKYGTFTLAAKSEHVAQPSLSQQILKLEDELGGKLFRRWSRGARLTRLGEFFLPHALTILHEIHECKAGARRIMAAGDAPLDRTFTPIALTAAAGEPSPLPLSATGLRAFRKGA